jgi:gentisate 1,2-dioxygenase
METIVLDALRQLEDKVVKDDKHMQGTWCFLDMMVYGDPREQVAKLYNTYRLQNDILQEHGYVMKPENGVLVCTFMWSPTIERPPVLPQQE